MPAIHQSRGLLILGTLGLTAASLVLVVGGADMRAAQDGKPDLTKAKFNGVANCIPCHKEAKDPFNTKLVLLTEYTTWITKDKHALAYAVLEGPRGQEIGRLLHVKVTEHAMCLACHTTSYRQDEGDKKAAFSRKDGVSCDGCHGPASAWQDLHWKEQAMWRQKPAKDKEALGMFDVRDPIKRSAMCMSCHVGSPAEGKVISHAMYAAGHPPLPSFLAASFAENLPKHWNDLKEVPYLQEEKNPKILKQYQYETADFQNTKLVLASHNMALRTAMRLLARRAQVDKKVQDQPAQAFEDAWPPPWISAYLHDEPKTRWPELEIHAAYKLPAEPSDCWPEIMMAQADCHACHHELKSNSWRQIRGYPGRPGRPQFPEWPLAALKQGLAGDEIKTEITAAAKQLRLAFDKQPFGEPLSVALGAAGLEKCARKLETPDRKLNKAVAMQLLRALCTLSDKDYPDYDTACQIAWAFNAIYTDGWNRSHLDPRIMTVLKTLDDELNLSVESTERKKYVTARYQMTEPLAKKGHQEVLTVLADQKAFLKPLKENNDLELRAALERISNYDPVTFRKRLAELFRLLPTQ